MHTARKHSALLLPLYLAAYTICVAETYTEHDEPSRIPAETHMAASQEAGESTSQRETMPRDTDRRARISTDDSIARALKSELSRDPLISPHRLGVEVSGATAVLTGTVTDLMTKDRATHIAETVKGVGAVRNDIVVVPRRAVSTDNLEAAIRTSLVSNPATDAFQVQIKATPDGQVVLTGEVDSWAERELVDRMARTINGVTSVRNDIEVRFRASRTDIDIEQEVERLLKWDAYIEEKDIDVSVRDGVVRLSGEVPSAAEKRRAIGLAYTAGTESVSADQLNVQAGPTSKADQGARAASNDAEVSQAVEAMLSRDPEANADAVDVTVAKGVVTLQGKVENAKAKRAALRRAEMVSGVREVRDELTVSMTRSDSQAREIARELVAALAANPITEAYKISVAVDEGIVTLTGHVDSWFERGTADDIASSIAGVRDVKNDLIVERAEDRLAYDPYVDTWSIYEYDWYTPKLPTTWKPDSEIVRGIEREFTWSPFVDGDQIDISVHKGVATLEGTVDSIAQIEAATENALEGGAAGVVNKLQIRG
jgi:osmotically-inducible protein OsmY